jgi:hypothetical protein
MALKDINPAESYNRDSFVGVMGDFSDLRGYRDILKEDGEEPETRKSLGSLLNDNSTHYSGISAADVKNDANEAYSQLERKLGGSAEVAEDRASVTKRKGYVETNLEEFLNKAKAEELMAVINSVNLHYTGDNAIDEVIRLVNESRKISEAKKSGNISAYVAERMKTAPEWRQRAFSSYSSGNHAYVAKSFETFAIETARELSRLVANENGELNKAKLVAVIKASLAVAEREYDRESDLGDKIDIFESDIRRNYLALAHAINPRLKQEKKQEEDSAREQRKAERKALGFAA